MTAVSSSSSRVLEVVSTQPGLAWSERLRLRADDRAPLGPKQVRIGMLAMTILPADLLQMQGRYGAQPDLPYVPGHEGVAVALELGPGVDDLQVGQRVLPLAAGGLWADERVLHRRALLPVPAEGDVWQQAMLCANPATAWVLLRHQRALQPGDWVAQNAANSAVGQCVRQLAAHLGLNVLNIVRRADAAPVGSSEHWLVDDGSDPAAVLARARQITDGAPVALGFDAIGGAATATLAACLSEGARLVVYGLLSGQPSQVAAHDLVFRGVQLSGFWLARWFGEPAHRELGKQVYPALMDLSRQGVLQMAVEQVYDLGEAALALAHAAREGRQGKVLLSGAWLARS
jgi:trans-2-enoyl-CoA reductase